MSAIPNPTNLAALRQATASLPAATQALNLLEQTQDYDAAIEQLIDLQSGTPQAFSQGSRPPLWPILKARLQQEICGEDDSFRAMLNDFKKNPANATLVIAAITYLINLAGLPFPIEASLATAILLRIADIGIDVFCEWAMPTG
jgi:hypothetical protein